MTSAPPLDVLALGAHPDDVEVGVGGFLSAAAERGLRCGVLDLTRGEMGSRGTPELRADEALSAARELGLAWRGNLELPDARLCADVPSRECLALVLRAARPHLLLAPWIEDPHPDHVAAGQLAIDAVFAAGVAQLAPDAPAPHRPAHLLHYPLGTLPALDGGCGMLLVDITSTLQQKLAAVRLHASQLTADDGRGSNGLRGRLTGPGLLDLVRRRAEELGHAGAVGAAEILLHRRPVLLDAGWLGLGL